MLFRANYVRNNQQCSMTFSRRNEALAALFLYETLMSYIRSISHSEVQLVDAYGQVVSVVPNWNTH